MARKPIVEIDVDDTRFKRFLDLFKAYSDKVDAMPEAWRKLDASMSGAGKSLGGAAAGAHEQLALAATSTSLVVEALNKAAAAQRGLGDATGGTARSMDRLATAAKGARDHISGIAGLLVRIAGWSGLGAALGGVGAGFGVAELAGSATGQSRSARGLGVSPGQLAAFRANLSPYIGTNVLQGAADAQADLSKRGWLATLGIGSQEAETLNPEEIALKEATAVRKAWQSTHNTNSAQAIAAQHLGWSVGDIRNIGSANARDLWQRMTAATTDADKLGFSDKVGRDWATLDTSLRKAGVTIESSLITGLVGLTPGISKLSDEISSFIASLLKNDAPAVIDEVGKGLTWLANYIGSKDFSESMTAFGQAVKTIGSDILQALRWFNLIPGAGGTDQKAADATPAPYDKDDARSNWPPALRKAAGLPPVNIVAPVDADAQIKEKPGLNEKDELKKFLKDPMAQYDFTSPEDQYKLPHGFLKALAMTESSGNVNAVSAKGARGLFQFTDETAKGLGVDASDPGQSAFGAAYLTRQNLDRYGGDLRKAIAAYNWGPGNDKDPRLDADIKAHGADWERYAPAETQKEIARVLSRLQTANTTKIIIQNQTNAKVFVQANAAGQ